MFDQNQVFVAAAIVFLGLSIPEAKETHLPSSNHQSRSVKHTTEAASKKNGKDNVASFLVSDAYCWSAI